MSAARVSRDGRAWGMDRMHGMGRAAGAVYVLGMGRMLTLAVTGAAGGAADTGSSGSSSA